MNLRSAAFPALLAAALAITMPSFASAQLTTYSIDHGLQVELECTEADAQCVLSLDCFSRVFRSSNVVTKDTERFAPSTGYLFNGNVAETAFVVGTNSCNPPPITTNCSITCDSSCTCVTKPDEFVEQDGSNFCYDGVSPEVEGATPCVVSSEDADGSIPLPSESITYDTPVDAALVEVRCLSKFNDCTGFSSFSSQKSYEATEDFAWGMDASGCDEAPCSFVCDSAACTCTVDGEDCDVLTEAPTASPTLTPTSSATHITLSTGVAMAFMLLAWKDEF